MVLIFSVGILTVVLAVVGVQIVRILGEVKKTVEGVNKILEDAGRLSENITKPTSSLTSLFVGAKMGLKILEIFLRRKGKKREKGNE